MIESENGKDYNKEYMKLLVQYMKNYKKECILGPLFKLCEAGLELMVPLIIASIVDQALPAFDRQKIVMNFVLLLLLAMCGCVFAVSAQYFSAKAAVGSVGDMKADLFSHIQTFGYREMDEVGSSTLITRLGNDMNQIQNGINLFLRLFLRSPFIVFGAIFMAFTIDSSLSLIFLGMMLLMFLVVLMIMLISIPLVKKSAKVLDKMTQRVRENLSGIRVIKAFQIEEKQADELDEENKAFTSIALLIGKINAFLNPLTTLILYLAMILLIHQGAIQVNLGNLSQGNLIALVSYMSAILVELVKLVNLILQLSKGLASATRVEEIFQIKSGYVSGKKKIQKNSEPLIALKHVGYRYGDDAKESVHDISFELHEHEKLGIIGPTGSGKSTLVHLMNRFYDTTSGTIQLYGEDIRHYDLHELLSFMKIVPQQAILFQGTLRDNLLWGNQEASDEEIIEACHHAQMHDFVDENGLDFVLEQNGLNLSGGQRQRLCIARALLSHPKVLFLDASTSALDYKTEKDLKEALNKHYSCTLITITQRISSIQNCDLIVVMDQGNMVGCGRHEELLANCEMYQKIYASNQGGVAA